MRAVKTRRLYVAWSVLFSIALFGQQKDLCGNVRCAPNDRECFAHHGLKRNGGPIYQDWLGEDVRWIITHEERVAFKTLSSDEQRHRFIEQFWFRRDPTSDTVGNEYREEHYRRLMFANEHFGTRVYRDGEAIEDVFTFVLGRQTQSKPERDQMAHLG